MRPQPKSKAALKAWKTPEALSRERRPRHLTGLLAGAPQAARALLPACTAEAYGAQAFGPVAIAELFARHPAPLSDTPHVLETARSLALFDADAEGGEQALVADLYDGRIGRIWRLGPGPLDAAAEPALALAFDPFLTQLRAPVALDGRDHPELDVSALAGLREVAEAVASGSAAGRPTLQGRAFVLRAFSAGDGAAAALLAVTRNTGVGHRDIRTDFAATALRVADGALVHARTIQDEAREIRRRPRV